MKTTIKTVLSAAAAFSAASMMAFTVFAEDYIADTSNAIESTEWGQTFVLRKEPGEEDVNLFDPIWMTEDSQVIVEYSLGDHDELTASPVELIIQGWVNPSGQETEADVAAWGKVAPVEYDEDSAVFNYSDIVEAYIGQVEKNSDFSADEIREKFGNDVLRYADAMDVGDTGSCAVTCTGFTVTNVDYSYVPADYENAAASDEDTAQEDTSSEEENLNAINVLVPNDNAEEISGFNECFRVTKYDFDSTRIFLDTKLVVKYELSGNALSCPVNLAVESTGNTESPKAKEDGSLSETVICQSYDDTQAVFSCAAITKAYGIGVFDQLYDFVISAAGTPVKVTGVEFTNVLSKGTRPVDSIASDEEDKGVNVGLIIGIAAVVVVGAAVGIFVYAKKSGGKAYDITSGTYVEAKPEEPNNEAEPVKLEDVPVPDPDKNFVDENGNKKY